MPIYTINVKWQKEKYADIECDTDQPPEIFKALMFSLSGVPPDRQKIMMTGGVLKDDSWENIRLKNGMTVMMMGSAADLPKAPAPTEMPKFMEDMDESQLAMAMDVPPGLNNLGNTCYMNATLQCLRSIPELKLSLPKLTHEMTGSTYEAHSLAINLKHLYAAMEKTADAVSPTFFLAILHNLFPQFATRGEQGVWQQQDANECWVEVVRCLQKALPPTDPTGKEVVSSSNSCGASGPNNFVDRYLGGTLECRLSSEECPDEEAVTTTESFYQLSCFIDKDVKYIQTGLRNGLEGTLVKLSPTLGRDAVYKKTSRLNRLPGYLAVQFVRFYYKEKENINAKVLKDIKFPITMDMYEFCTEALQKRLVPMREKFKEEEDRIAEEVSLRKGNMAAVAAGALEEVNKKKEEKKTSPYWFEDDPGSNNSGYYDLQAVLTHQGRSSNSGHYVAWVRRKEDEWFKFDDEKVSSVTSEEILKLSGGGDWHCAYILLYGPRKLALPEESTSAAGCAKAESTPAETMETS